MTIEGLDKLVSEGHGLLNNSDPVGAHMDFERWTRNVLKWLGKNYPDSGLSAQWVCLGSSYLVTGNSYSNDQSAWMLFKVTVEKRLKWIGSLATNAALLQMAKPSIVQEEAQAAGRKEVKLQLTSHAYVDPDRIKNLGLLSGSKFDLSKLIRLCEELNICFATECYLSMIMVTRSILDHIPPIFDRGSFKELANNYGAGGKSFKDQMQNLENYSRKIADSYLHLPVRTSETLPTITQVDFSNAIDSLLGEIIRILKPNNTLL
jgi:hypothetical protein